MPLLGVMQTVVERALRDPDHLRADPDAALVERLDGDLVALAHLAEHVSLGHPAAFQHQLAGRGRPDAELVLLLADLEAREGALDQEARDALVALRGVDRRHHDEQVGLGRVGDPQLPARQLVVVALVGGPAGEGERVGAGARLGERVGPYPFGGEPREIAGLLLVASPAQEGVVHEGVLHVHQHRQRRVHPRQLLDDEDGHEEGRAGASHGLGDLDPHDAELEALVYELARDVGLLVHLADEGAHFRLGELSHLVAEHPLVVGEVGQREAAGGSERLGHPSPRESHANAKTP